MRLLFSEGRNELRVDEVEVHGQTPLHYAVMRGAVNVIELLLQHKANLYAVDNEGNSVLHFACALVCITLPLP